MKNLVLSAMFLLVLFSALAKAEEVPVLKNGTLVITEVKEVKRISGVPEGLSAETAYELVTGELEESVIVDKNREKRKFLFSYPLREKITFSDRSISYRQGKWVERTVSRVEEGPDWTLTFLWLIMPAICILIVSMTNQLTKSGTRKLFVFYCAIIAGVLAGVLAGWLAGEQDYWMVIFYLIFIVAAEITSFMVARLAAEIKKRAPAVKKWVLEE